MITKVTTSSGIYLELDYSVKNTFKKGQAKHIKYIRKLEKHTMIYATHILDPRCKSSMITMMMGDKAGAILTAVKKYFRTEWPQTDAARTPTVSSSLSVSLPGPRPSNISIARWKALQQQHEQHAEGSIAPLLSELDEWLHSKPEEWNSLDSPDYVPLWWKGHQLQWPHLAAAARDLLPCSASEVDVERLFSGCRDEYGIRRHSLKAETVRVLVLLQCLPDGR